MPPSLFLSPGLAVLTLLSEVAEERPLLRVVDDAQWLDAASAQVLAFAARRLLAEPVGLVFAARDPGEQLRGLTDLEVEGLPDQEARALAVSGRWVAAIEVAEELGLDRSPGRVLAVAWAPSRPERPESVVVIYDGGCVPALTYGCVSFGGAWFGLMPVCWAVCRCWRGVPGGLRPVTFGLPGDPDGREA